MTGTDARTSLGDRAARGSGIVLATQAVKVLVQFGSLVVLARLLSPEDFGLAAMVISVIGIADLLREFGLSSAVVQAKTVSAGERTNLFWVNVGFGLLCTVLVSAAAPLIVLMYDGRTELAPVTLALAWVFLISGTNTQFRADLTRSMRYASLALSDVASQVLGLAVAIVLAANGAGVWAIVGQQLTAALVALMVNVASTRWIPGWPQRHVSVRRFLRFGGNLFATQALTYLTKNVDNISLGIVFGPTPLGYYSRAYQLLMAPLNQINAPMTGVALPVLSRVQDDDERFVHYLRRGQLLACYLTATVFTVCAGLSEPLVLVLFGQDWLPVAPIFAILALGGIFRSIQQIAFWTYLARAQTGAQLRMILVTRPIMIGMMLAGLPWGPVGVAAGHSLGYLMFWVVSTWHAGRSTGVDGWALMRGAARPVLLVSAPAGIVAWAATLIAVAPVLQLLIGTGAALTCLGLMMLFSRTVRGDVRILFAFLRRAVGTRSRRR
ncbi:lipopolysaccharide biosynthesis protein [Nakamurella sp.]|uniref:lipopolysaccharide biosynthesis protein n=1 Tax=Nakamurella sp. TaxID=1869182 RepID=UPI003B39FD50